MDPANRLAVLLDGISAIDFSGSKHTMAMDKVYMGIIRAAQPDPIGDWTAHFQTCVGTIVLLHDPLPCDALAQLIGIEINVILRTLSNLHSLLAPSADTQTFRVHHKSFPDFISDPDRCILDPQLCIDRTAHNFRIALRCLHIMDLLLKPNLCDLEPNEWHMDRAQIAHRIQHKVSPCLAYACTYWASHLVAALEGGAVLDAEGKDLLERFASKHILTWLEALSLIGRTATAYTSLDIIRTIGQQCHFPDIVQELLHDGCEFIQRNSDILQSFPMQIYNSALLFAPRNTALFRAYGGLYTRDVDIISRHHGVISFMTFLPDGPKLALAVDMTIQLWDGVIGFHIVTLQRVFDPVSTLAFSMDGSKFASVPGDRDWTIQLWDVRSDRPIAVLEGHSDSVNSVTFSADGSRLASASLDNTARLWDTRTGRCIATLKSHLGPVRSVVFSLDGRRLASASDDQEVCLWDVRTGARIAILNGHSGPVTSVEFSADGTTLASASLDSSIRLWDGRTGYPIATLHEHFGEVKFIKFSADDSRLISLSNDNTVLVWDTTDTTRPYVLCQKTAVNAFYLGSRNCLFLLETRKDPTLCGLTVLNLDRRSFDTRVICWFPSHLTPHRLAVHPEALTPAVLCDDGHFLLDISKVLVF